MRVLRTELFFERSAFRWMTFDWAPTSPDVLEEASHRPYEPNISIAWLKLDYDEEPIDGWSTPELGAIERFIADTLRGHGNPALRRATVGPGLMSAVLSAEVVIELSPPTLVHLTDLLRHAGRQATGVSLGYLAAGNDPHLMLLTVPAGVIIMGTVTGVSLRLQEGLHKLIKEALSPKRRLK